ncbi:ankyrin [Piromyces finnis]|uniref:Ankyrin n=1 Tax=Piromyces finnis TaxID=1754191 RepID=A0A1Y1VA49_9FUNG|nr:ankyrin [Piromyces finnis]|eukprot:ORX49634.1 ankyrin [Piromyces finnis]
MINLFKIINENNLDKLKNYIKNNNINLQDLKEEFNGYNGYTNLKQCIENKVSPEIFEFINIHGKYNLLNSTFLSISIEKHNFEIAKYIIENGTEVNSLSYGNIILKKTKRGTQYLIRNGLNINSELLMELIKINNHVFLNQIFNNYIYDNSFILSLLSFQKNKTKLSYTELFDMTKKEKEKIKFNKTMYEVAIMNNCIETIMLLYLYDTRETNVIAKNIISILNQNNKLKGPFLNKIKNSPFKISTKEKLINILESNKTKQEIKYKISQLIKNNNVYHLKSYIKENNIKLADYREDFNQKDDILKFTIKSSYSIEMLNFIYKTCHYENLDFSSDKNYKDDTTLFYLVLSKNKFKFFDFLIKIGLNINKIDILTWLYEDRILDNKKLKYILNCQFQILPNTINQLIVDNKLDLLKCIFEKYIYNNLFILKLLSIYKNHTTLSKKTKININDLMYEKALESNNFEAITFLYINDNRNKEQIFKDIFQLLDKDKYIYCNERKKSFIQNIKKMDLIPLDSFFIDNLNNSEEDILELKKYIIKYNIILSYFNNKLFDLLIYTIEKDISFNTISFLMSHYLSLDYVVVDSKDSRKYKSPLYCAIANKRYNIASLFLKNGANINFKIHEKEIIVKLYEERLLNKKALKLLIKNNITISSEFLDILIKNRKYDLLFTIFKYNVFDNTFILNLLTLSTHKTPLSNNQLLNIMVNEESKIDIGKDWYKNIIINKDSGFLEILYHYRLLKKELNFVLDKNEIECILNHAIENDDYILIEKNIDIENILINYQYICNHYNILTFLLTKVFDKEQYNIKNVKFYEKMGILDLNNLSIFKFFKFYIHKWINHKNFNFIDFDLEKILESLNTSIEITFKNKAIYLTKFFIDTALNNETFDFNVISFENLLSILVNQIYCYQMEYGNRIEHIVLIKMVIEQFINHKTFGFKLIDLDEILFILNQLQNTQPGFNEDIFSKLIKFTIKMIIQHKSFDFNSLNIKKIIFLLIYQKNHITNIKFLLKELFNCPSFTLKNKNINKDMILTISKIENIELIEFMMNNITHHPTFNEENICIQEFLQVVIKIKDFQIFKYIIEKYFKQFYPIQLDSNNIEKIFMIIGKINNSIFIDFLINYLFHHEIFDLKKYIDNKSIDINKILKFSIKNNNVHLINYFNEYLLNNNDIKKDLIENLLLFSNKIDNTLVAKSLIEKLFNIEDFESITEINNLELKGLDNAYLILLLNIYIKLCSKKPIQYIIENNQININSRDKNGDYPLITAFYSLNEDNESKIIEIFDYLLDKGANVNIKNINNIPLIILALKNRKYIILQHLFRKSVSININSKNKKSSLLLTAIEQNNIDNVKSLINNENYNIKNENNNVNNDSWLTPLTLSYLLRRQEIFEVLINSSYIHSLDCYGYNILHFALFKEDKELIKNLILRNIEINSIKNNSCFKGHSSIEISIHLKNRELLLLLLKNKNVSINKTYIDKNPLLVAITMMRNYSLKEKLEWMGDLIKNGADVNSYDKNGLSIFMIAFKENALPIIKLLVENGANINNSINKNNKKMSIIRYAIENEDISKIECLIKHNKKDSLLDEDIETIINNDRLDIIQKLIPQYININRKDEYGFSLLCRAVFSDNIRIAKYFIDNGINIHNSINKIIEQIIYKTNLPMLKLLIPDYIDVNSKFNSSNEDYPQSLLKCAIDISNEPLIHYLIRCNADFQDVPNKTSLLDNYFNNNPKSSEIYPFIIKNSSLNEILIEIIEKERMDLLEILIDYGLDINKQYRDGKTLLIYAIEKRYIKLIEYLIENNVNINSLKCNFIKEIIIDKKVDILKFLLSNNIKIQYKYKYLNLIYTISNNIENSVLTILKKLDDISVVNDKIEIKDFIVEKDNVNMLKQIIPKIIDIHVKDINKYTPLVYAVESKNKEIIDYLIKCGASWEELKSIDINIELFKSFIHLQLPNILTIFNNNILKIHQKDENKDSMLIYSIQHGCEKVVKYLIDKGADINEQNGSGDVPLSIAIKKRKVDSFKLLIDNGADKSFTNNSNESLYDINKKYNNTEYQKVYIQINSILNHSIKNDNNYSSIKLAIISNNIIVVKELLEKDPANIESINKNIEIFKILVKKNSIEMIKCLVEHHLNVNAKDSQGFTPLIYAIMEENEMIIKYLITNGSNLTSINHINIESELFKSILKMDKSENLQSFHLLNIIYHNSIKGNQNDNNYDPIICFSIIHGKESLVQYLIDQGADVNSYSRSYKCPLILAIQTAKENIVKCLIRNGAKLNNYKENPPLVEAIKTNNENIIKYLIECGIDINERSHNVGSDTSLTVAIKNNNENLVKYLIEYGVEMNTEINQGESALIYAVRNQNMNIIQYLVESGADVNYKLCFNSPLLESIVSSNENIIKYLIDVGADVNVTNKDGESPLDLAIKNNMEGIINYLIYHKAKIDPNALIEASRTNNLNIVKYLIDNGADIKTSNTPLNLAIQNRNEAMVKYLIYCGADVNKSENLLPLVIAINNNDERFVKLLIQCGADINMDGGGYFVNIPLVCAVKNNNENLSRYLIQCGADINRCRQMYETPLIYAIQNENENLIRFLVDSGANIEKEGINGQHGANIDKSDALICAIDNGNDTIARYLIHQGANININDNNNGTPLCHAVQNGQMKLVKYLIENQADINQVTRDGEKTAISFAAIHGDENIIRYLIDKGSHINGERCRFTPLYYAIQHQNLNSIALLLDCGANINILKGGQTHLLTAIKTKNERMIKYLIDHGANVNQCDINDLTPLSCAIGLTDHYNRYYGFDDRSKDDDESAISFERKKERIVKYLIDHGADVHQDNGAVAPIIKAIDNGNIEIISYLIKHGVDINKKNYKSDDDTSYPLIRAIQGNNEKIVKFLISCGANVNQRMRYDETPLIYTIKNPTNSNKDYYQFSYFNDQEYEEEQQKNIEKKERIVKYLVEHGAEVNSEDYFGQHSLIHCIHAKNDNNIKIIDYLVNNGVDINKVDKQGNNALSLAMKNHHDIFVKYLLDLGATPPINKN